MEAACFNQARLALLRLGNPLRVELTRHRGLAVILHDDYWLCVDSNASDQLVMAWREFEIQARTNLHEPISCNLYLYHYCAGLIMGSALDDLHQAIDMMIRTVRDRPRFAIT